MVATPGSISIDLKSQLLFKSPIHSPWTVIPGPPSPQQPARPSTSTRCHPESLHESIIDPFTRPFDHHHHAVQQSDPPLTRASHAIPRRAHILQVLWTTSIQDSEDSFLAY